MSDQGVWHLTVILTLFRLPFISVLDIPFHISIYFHNHLMRRWHRLQIAVDHVRRQFDSFYVPSVEYKPAHTMTECGVPYFGLVVINSSMIYSIIFGSIIMLCVVHLTKRSAYL